MALPGGAYGQPPSITFGNGDDCSNPLNVISDATWYGWWVKVINGTEICIVDEGYLTKVSAYDSSAVTISSGEVEEWLTASYSSTVTITGGGVGGALVTAYGSSTITMSGGWLGGNVYLEESSTLTMSGGNLGNDLFVYDSSTATITGGTLGSYYFPSKLYAEDWSTITIAGSNFAVDGSPVPYGHLTAQTGTLTGTLCSGDPIDNEFYQGGGDYTGTITLVRRLPALSSWGKLALGASLLCAGSLAVVVMRRRAG